MRCHRGRGEEVDAERRAQGSSSSSSDAEWKLRKGPRGELREPLRAAYKTPGRQAHQEQKALLDKHPSVRQISPGSLYLYDRELTRDRQAQPERKKVDAGNAADKARR
ncbi:MAG: hypothetical protein CM1200mP34_5440 [Verrucomicrobiales bacterium]|nr:MAG: hypothetical protein CM1200mP34_5440 [Verrucomicrobiales bacterium]